MTALVDMSSTLSDADLRETAVSIAAIQEMNGFIPFTLGGIGDPWNHVEAAMALSIAGMWPEAERAYEWLWSAQRIDGAWYGGYRADGSVSDERCNTNVSAYAAMGVWHHYLVTGDRTFADGCFSAIDAAMSFVLDLQQPTGEIVWVREVDGCASTLALRAACSSIYASLCAALQLANELGYLRPRWGAAALRLARALRERPMLFADKYEYAMDWYYPVLGGVINGVSAQEHLRRDWSSFHVETHGIRCQSTKDWVTTAETAECALALARSGSLAEAKVLFACTAARRMVDGSYLTGRVYSSGQEFPPRERSSYSAAAVILAADVLRGGEASCRVFGIPTSS